MEACAMNEAKHCCRFRGLGESGNVRVVQGEAGLSRSRERELGRESGEQHDGLATESAGEGLMASEASHQAERLQSGNCGARCRCGDAGHNSRGARTERRRKRPNGGEADAAAPLPRDKRRRTGSFGSVSACRNASPLQGVGDLQGVGECRWRSA